MSSQQCSSQLSMLITTLVQVVTQVGPGDKFMICMNKYDNAMAMFVNIELLGF